MFFFFELYCDHLDLHVLTHSFPKRRSSDLSSVSIFRVTKLRPGLQTMTRALLIFMKNLYEMKAAAPRRAPVVRGMRYITAPSCQGRSEEHTSELQSLMRISYAVCCLKKQKITTKSQHDPTTHICTKP